MRACGFNRLGSFRWRVNKSTRVGTRRGCKRRFGILASSLGCFVIAGGYFVLRLAEQIVVNFAGPSGLGCGFSRFGFGFVAESGQLGQNHGSGAHGKRRNEKFFHTVFLKKS